MAAIHGYFEMSEKDLVNHIAETITGRQGDNNIPLAEMQRRQIEAVRALNRSATFQAWVMIALTVAILMLTAVMAWQPIAAFVR
jgi:hypothetical protein